MRNELIAAREAAGYTQESMAEAIDTGYSNYGKIERGEKGGSLRIWNALEDLLGVPKRILQEDSERHDKARGSASTCNRRRAKGLCTMCGGEIEDSEHVNCRACREKNAEKARLQYSKRRAAEEMERYEAIDAWRAEITRAIERERAFKAMGKCLNCVWAQKHATHLFCPFPAGACMRL